MSLHTTKGSNFIKLGTSLGERKPQHLIKPLNFSENKIAKRIDLVMGPDFVRSVVQNRVPHCALLLLCVAVKAVLQNGKKVSPSFPWTSQCSDLASAIH